EMGRYLCLTKGQWQRGLPMLAKGDDAKLKALAEKDLTKPKDAKMQVELADAWSELGESMKGTPNIHVMGRAFHWYAEALPKIEGGLTRLRVQRQIDELAKLFPAAGGRTADVSAEIRRFENAGFAGIMAVAIAADGKLAISAGNGEPRIRLWDVAKGKNLRTF